MSAAIYDKKCVVIGAGVAGLSAASTLSRKGYHVTLVEKNLQTGGRARVLKQDGFTFDMGPSWYWMPEVIERFFNSFGKSTADFFQLIRLDPSYQVIFGKDEVMRIPADFESLKELFEKTEPGSARKLVEFLQGAEYKYKAGMEDFVYRPSLSISEFMEWRFIASFFKLDMLNSFSSHARKYFRNEKLIKLLEFPVLFLGAMPSKTPALYSMMNYADMKLGTWYPMGGMYKLAEAMTTIAQTNGVDIKLGEPVLKISTKNSMADRVITPSGEFHSDAVIAGADYHHVETKLLDSGDRGYSDKYWDSRTLAPSCLIYYLGVNKKLSKLLHHNLFFDEDFDDHANAIYKTKAWPKHPLFYACCPSVTDPTVAPKDMENLFLLIPVASGLNDTNDIRVEYFNKIMKRLEEYCGENISDHIVVKKTYATSDFKSDYNAFKGNAYGLANTLMQTAFLKPSMQSKRVRNLFYTGQLTVPGPGVPPSIISGQVVADYVSKKIQQLT